MTPIGLVFLAAAVAGLVVFGRAGYLWVCATAAGLPNTAALVVNDNAVSIFHTLLGPGLVLAAIGRTPSSTGRRVWLTPALMLVSWSVVVTALAPWLFAGTRVLSPRGGMEVAPVGLGYSISNAAQIGYLLLAVAFLWNVSRTSGCHHIAAAPLAMATVLASINLFFVQVGLDWPAEVFDTSTNLIYQASEFNGQPRLRGPFAEPSLLAELSVAAMAYFLTAVKRTRPLVSGVFVSLAVLAAINLNASASGTALIATVSTVLLMAGYVGWLTLRGRVFGGKVLFGILSILIGLYATGVGESLIDKAVSIFSDKQGSVSMRARAGANDIAVDVALHTWGLGAGLGSNRPSSFLLLLLSCVGVFGLSLFCLIVWRLGAGAWHLQAKWVSWGIIGSLTAKVVAVPDLSSPYLWVLLAECSFYLSKTTQGASCAANMRRATPRRHPTSSTLATLLAEARSPDGGHCLRPVGEADTPTGDRDSFARDPCDTGSTPPHQAPQRPLI